MSGIQAKQLGDSVWLAPYVYGTGEDGDIVTGGTTTATEDVLASSFHVLAGGIWYGQNFRIYCASPVLVEGTIDCSGIDGASDSAGGAGGVAIPSGTLAAGGNGGSGPGPGSIPGNAGQGASVVGSGYVLSSGGAGHAGGGHAHVPGGLGGTPVPRPVERGRSLLDVILAGASVLARAGGWGGGSGCSNDVATGAGGGSGGGQIEIWAPKITIASTGVIRARGGVGGACISDGVGGGGGGTGGVIKLMTPTLVVMPGGIIDVSGGLGGAGTRPGFPGGIGTTLP